MGVAGYDDPIDEESADLLGRAGFARELASLAVAAPLGWSTRVGIYGRWGDGKTSVVRLAQRYLDAEGHLTVDYNPWGCRDAQEMIAVLADSIFERLKREEIDVPGGMKRAAKRFGGALAATTEAAEKIDLGTGGAVASAVMTRLSPWLQRWAKERREDIVKALHVIESHRRLVVFVDDVDRLDPKLLPMLLFALHEVFAIPGVTFVVALDPGVVGAALSEYHAGFGDGLAFLEKIVQFPRWLPPVTEEDLLRIAEADRRMHAPFITASVLTDNRGILPQNPRELRMLVRGLMTLRRAFERHDPDELDQNLLILLACFRQRFPQTLLRMLQDEELLDSIGMSAATDDDAKVVAERMLALALLSNELGDNERGDRADRFAHLVNAFCGRSWLWRAQHIRYHANLTDRPDAVTWKEFRALIADAPATSAEVDDWMARHARQVKAPISVVARELFDCVVRYHSKTMDESATAGTADAQADRVRRVGVAVSMLQVLWFTSSQSASLRTPQHLRDVIRTFRGWAHFNLNPNDKEQRQAESVLLDEMIAVVDNPTECLALLEPWNHDGYRKNAGVLTDRITEGLVARASMHAVDRFAEPAGINTMHRAKQYAAEYVLMQASPTWSDENRRKLKQFGAAAPQVVAENVRLFAESLVEPSSFQAAARTLLADRALVVIWWSLIIGVRWQARFFRGLEKLRRQLEAGTPLPSPSWWEEVRALAYNRKSPDASDQDDERAELADDVEDDEDDDDGVDG